MKKLRVYIETGYAGCNSIDEMKIDESWTKEDIEEAARDIFFNQCNYSYEVVDE
jgi:hypothetical protein